MAGHDHRKRRIALPPRCRLCQSQGLVLHVLEKFFRMDREKATRIMLHVHTQGKGLCGVFVKEIAETKVAQVNDYARSHNHPLLCTMEVV